MIYDIMPVNNYKGNSSCTTFDFDFYIENEEQLKVYFIDKNETKYLLHYGTDYTINEFKNKNGSFIVFPVADSNYEVLKEDEKISLELSLSISQETQYNNSSLLNLTSLEYSFDYLTRLIQILNRKMQLCLKVQEGQDTAPDTLMNSLKNSEINCATYLKSVQENLETTNQLTLASENYANIATEAVEIIKPENYAKVDFSNLSDDAMLLFDNKLSKDHSNDEKPYIVETYQNNTSWYRVWSDGWCEQGGRTSVDRGVKTVTLLKPYRDVNYSISTQSYYLSPSHGSIALVELSSKANSSFKMEDYYAYGTDWRTCGYIT